VWDFSSTQTLLERVAGSLTGAALASKPRELRGHSAAIVALAVMNFGGADARIASSALDGTLRTWMPGQSPNARAASACVACALQNM
jgi:hypothetical protein